MRVLLLLVLVAAALTGTDRCFVGTKPPPEHQSNFTDNKKEPWRCPPAAASWVRPVVEGDAAQVLRCNERYATRVQCGADLLFTRADFLRCDGGDCKLVTRQTVRANNNARRRILDDVFFPSGGAENAAWTCARDGVLGVFAGTGYGVGGAGIFYNEVSVADLLSGAEVRREGWRLAISANRSASGCAERVSYMERFPDKCAFDGKLAIARGMAFARENRCSRGGRHVQVFSFSDGRFRSTAFDGVDPNRADNNLYYLVAVAHDDVLLGAFPGVVRGAAGVFLTSSRDGVRWSKPALAVPSTLRRAWRTVHHVVDDLVVANDTVYFSVQHASVPASRDDERRARQKPPGCAAAADERALCERCYEKEEGNGRPLCRYAALVDRLRPPRTRVIFAGELRLRDEAHFERVRASCRGADVYVVTYARYARLAERLGARIAFVDEPEFVDRAVVAGKDTAVVSAAWFSSLCDTLENKSASSGCKASIVRGVRVAVAYPGAVQWGLLDLAMRTWEIGAQDIVVRARTDVDLRRVGEEEEEDLSSFRYADLRPEAGLVYCHSDKFFYARGDVFLRVFRGFRDSMMTDFNHHAKSIQNRRFYSEAAFAEHLRRHHHFGADNDDAPCERPCLVSRNDYDDDTTTTTSGRIKNGTAARCKVRLAVSLLRDRRNYTFLLRGR